MGERGVGQEALFYEFSLERHVPADHLLRSIDRFVDLSGIRAHLRPFYSEIGRPSIDPELERDPRRLNRKAGDSRRSNFLIQDAGWGWGPASDGKTLFTGPTGSGCRFGNSGAVVPGDGGAVWGKRGQRGEVVAALAADG